MCGRVNRLDRIEMPLMSFAVLTKLVRNVEVDMFNSTICQIQMLLSAITHATILLSCLFFSSSLIDCFGLRAGLSDLRVHCKGCHFTRECKNWDPLVDLPKVFV